MENSISIHTSNINDLQFGFQLLGDYARFILNAIGPGSISEAEKAREFIALFDGRYARSRQTLSSDELKQLNRQAFEDVQEFRKYVLQILRLQISRTIVINLKPQTLNMMTNTTELLLDGLSAYMRNAFPDTAHLTSTWLQNIHITALDIQDKLGILYFEEKAKAGGFADRFFDLFNKSLIIDGMRRTGLENLPAFKQFFNQIRKNMLAYAEYLVDLTVMISAKEYVGMLTLLEVDSTYRRVCFFITKLSLISEIEPPVCDPAGPRRE
jgi:hypothetical protein